nr:putative holin-like toxin [Bacillus subtilis]
MLMLAFGSFIIALLTYIKEEIDPPLELGKVKG